MAQSFFEGYLWGWLIVVSIPVGSIGIWIIHSLTGGAWGVPLEKYYKCLGWTLPIAFFLGLPIMWWLPRLYEWTTLSPEILSHKSLYLNVPFFTARALVYFCIWLGMLAWLTWAKRGINLSGLFACLYIFAGTFAGFDWAMSLDYQWYSTMFGILFVVGQVLLSFCLLIVLYIRFDDATRRRQENPGLSRDRGNLILTMVMLWAYMSFAQYLIIWMGNLPEEIHWYLPRIKGGWGFIASMLIVGHFFVPFLMLLRRAWKEHPGSLEAIAVGIIGMRIIDVAWTIFPALGRPLSGITWPHLATAALIVGFYLFVLINRVRHSYERT